MGDAATPSPQKRDREAALGGDDAENRGPAEQNGAAAGAAEAQEDSPAKRRRTNGNGVARANGAGGDGDDGGSSGSDSDSSDSDSDSDSSDPSDSSDSDSEADVDDGVNALREKAKKRTVNVAECGIIEKLHLVNFMCHANLEIKLGPNVNFIHGQNGSGKSAILVALQTCLGSRASETNRGSSLGDLVREGEPAGSVTVTIKNRGPDAYKPDEYGRSISVERKLRRAGGSAYRLLDEHGKKVSTSRRDLEDMLDRFNIQVSNPCCVMSQDTSREFLQSKKNEDKYRFYLNATQLSRMGDDLAKAKAALDEMNATLSEKHEEQAVQEMQVKDLEQEMNSVKHLQAAEQQIVDLREDAMWSYMREGREAADKAARSVESCEKRLLKARAELETHNASQAEFEAARDAIRAELHECNGELAALAAEMRAATQKRDAAIKAAADAKHTVARVRREIQKAEKERRDAKETMESSIREADANNGDEEIRRAGEEMEAARAELNAAREEETRLRLEVEELEGGEANGDAEVERARRAAERAAEDAEEYKVRLREEEQLARRGSRARADQANPAMYGGRPAQDLVELVARNARQFEEPPVGPLGMHIKVHERKWAAAAEIFLTQRVLGSFLVSSQRDRRTLQKMMQQTHRGGVKWPSIYVQKKEANKYDIASRFRKPQGLTSMMDMLSVEDPWVYNSVVVNTQAERWMVSADGREANDIVDRHRGVIRGVVDEQGRKLQGTRGTKSYQGYREARGLVKVAQMTQADYEEEIAALRAQYDRYKARAQDARAAHEQLKREKGAFAGRKTKAERAYRRAVERVERAETRASDAELELEEARRSNAKQSADERAKWIADFQQDVDHWERTVQQLRDELADNEERALAAAGAKKAEVAAVAAIEAREEELGRLNDDIQARLEELLKRSSTSGKRRAKVEEQIVELEAELGERRAKATELEEAAVEALKFAQDAGPDRKNPKSCREINDQIDGLREMVQHETKRLGRSLDQVEEEFMAAKQRQTETATQVFRAETNAKNMLLAWTDRYAQWKLFRKAVAQSALKFFKFYLEQQGHSGSIRFDHEKKTLQLTVVTNKSAGAGKSARRTTDTKSLSGGERAFSTLSFVMALGESVDCPIRALDEFDIFMDSVNRRVSINILLTIAAQSRDRQYILLTPGDISSVPQSEYINIFKIRPPKRAAVGR